MDLDDVEQRTAYGKVPNSHTKTSFMDLDEGNV